MNIDPLAYRAPGLYLLLPTGRQIDLTRAAIEERTQAMLQDPTRLPDHVRAAADYQPCEICPMADSAEICHSIMTTLPFFDELADVFSYEHVTAIYVDEGSDVLQIRHTTMQEALKFVAILALMHYCEVGMSYDAFFQHVNPLMKPRDIAAAVFKNIHLACHGDHASITAIITAMQRDLLHTSRCQVKRLQLIGKSDAFRNAFVNTQAATEFLLLELRRYLKGTVA